MLLMVMVNIYSIISIKSMEMKYSNMLSKMVQLSSINEDVSLSIFYLDKYFSTNDQSDLNNYRENITRAKRISNTLDTSIEDEGAMFIIDLQNILQSYDESGENTIFRFLSLGQSDEFYSSFLETKQLSTYVTDYVHIIYDSYLKYNNEVYRNIVAQNEKSRIFITIFFVVITFMCIIFSVVFSKKITVPIIQLVKSTERVSKGNFNISPIKSLGTYEIDILAEGFNRMVRDINTLVEKIKEKAHIEKKLKDEEMKNLVIESSLKETKLRALQAQINPHFLFNTLNAIVQTAVIEDAPETEKLINSVSQLLRYSIYMIEKQSDIKSEIDIVRQYICIQEARFFDRVKFNLMVEEAVQHLEIPGMILQPLVENAFMHGIESKEEGGTINISVYEQGDFCFIKIEDDGVGMSKEKINEILNQEAIEEHSGLTGIGVRNVINRLRLLYDYKDVFQIDSIEQQGTRIYIKIPIRGEGEHV